LNRQIRAEAQHILYECNTFDLTPRGSLVLLQQFALEDTFHHVTSLILDWDQLQDFAFALARPAFVDLTANLKVLSLKHWRTRVLGGSSSLWRDVKAYERVLCGAALAITRKSRSLRLVAQHHWQRRAGSASAMLMQRNLEAAAGRGEGSLPDQHARVQGTLEGERRPARASMTARIKWRFLADESQMWKRETRIDVEAELAALMVGVEHEAPRHSALDPV
jgi:hypothetical protein